MTLLTQREAAVWLGLSERTGFALLPSSCLRRGRPPRSLLRIRGVCRIASERCYKRGAAMNSNLLTELAARINEAYEAVPRHRKGPSNLPSRPASYFKKQRTS